ncbi:RDD family protein [Hymenobacter sp. BRD67]|uniref:RDD family protein n=1 Tax=Hymenobacter sp. BRD67 TaxID=2675877 RepID=UPI001566A316|nr:RDD family protein [Hymenobacter sp. BRD67]QKG53525.1 RDD family protein [Hymenobacter sp. BRD67]
MLAAYIPAASFMEASKIRRLLTWVVDIGCILFLFLGLLRLLPTGLLKPEGYRFVVLAIMFAYYAGMEIFFKRTIGKLLTGTQLVTNNDAAPHTGQLLLRTACRFLPLEPLSLLFSSNKLAWHDRVSKTKVIHLDY